MCNDLDQGITGVGDVYSITGHRLQAFKIFIYRDETKTEITIILHNYQEVGLHQTDLKYHANRKNWS